MFLSNFALELSFFFLLSEGDLHSQETFGTILYFWDSSIVQFCIEICKYYRAASPWNFFFSSHFFLLLDTFTDTFHKVQSISFGVLRAISIEGFCDLFLLKGFWTCLFI
jgi:hypothetical protein